MSPTGYQLLTSEQRERLDDLTERACHSDSMRFTGVDNMELEELEQLCVRLEDEYRIDQKVCC